MKIELTKGNIEGTSKVLNEKLAEAFINLEGTFITGVIGAVIEFCEIDIPEGQRENGEEDYIKIELLFNGGEMVRDFVPAREVCEIFFDTDGGITFTIENIDKYIEREKSLLDFRLQEYEKYMDK